MLVQQVTAGDCSSVATDGFIYCWLGCFVVVFFVFWGCGGGGGGGGCVCVCERERQREG